mgnify:CR=1 FL=1
MKSYKINPVTKTLIISAAFEKSMNDLASDEYALYAQLQRDIPSLRVSRRTHKTPAKYHTKSGEVFRCNQYKHLTYENMERFINSLPKCDELMEVYNYIRYGAGLVQTSCYAAVRRWFEAQFPDIRKNPLIYFNQDIKVITAIEPFIKIAVEDTQGYEKIS